MRRSLVSIGLLSLLGAGVASFAECESDLVTMEEAEATVHWDLMALDDGHPVVAADFSAMKDATQPNLLTMNRVTRPRELEILRGYAAFLAERPEARAILYRCPFVFTRHFRGVIFDPTTGEAIESLGLAVTKRPEDNRLTRGEMKRVLRETLRVALLGEDSQDIVIPPPRWASVGDMPLINEHVFFAIWREDDIAEGNRINISKLRAKENYIDELREKARWKNFVNPRETTNPPRGRLVYDMISNGYGLDFMDSAELRDVIENIKPLTAQGRYDVTLFWDSRHLIEITRGRELKHGYFDPGRARR